MPAGSKLSNGQLQLTAFEHYMLADDRPDYPMNVFIRLSFSGKFERARLQQAFSTALLYHPLLNSIVKGDANGRTKNLTWVVAAQAPQIIFCEPHENPENYNFPAGMNLTLAVGIRVWCFREADCPVLVVQWHHSCCDGLGMLHFMETVLLVNKKQNAESYVPAPALIQKDAWWQQRASRVPSCLENLWRWPHDWLRILAYHFHNVLPLESKNEIQNASPTFAKARYWLTDRLNRAETAAVLKTAKARNLTVNDFLLALYFRCVESSGFLDSGDTKKYLRLAVPVNLRRTNELQPAVNHVSMVFIDRTPNQIHDPEQLALSIRTEMSGVKCKQTGWAMIRLLKMFGRVKNGMQLLLKLSGSRITSVFSNYGAIFRDSDLLDQNNQVDAGTCVLENIEPYPVLREGIRLGVNAVSYAEQLTLTMNFDQNYFTQSEAKEILDTFRKQLISASA